MIKHEILAIFIFLSCGNFPLVHLDFVAYFIYWILRFIAAFVMFSII